MRFSGKTKAAVALLVLLGVGSALLLASISTSTASAGTDANPENKIHYEPTLDSLAQWTVPEWYENAVLGIYMHWGVYSVPAFRFRSEVEEVDSGLWYGAQMYNTNNKYGVYKHHLETYGDPAKFGYKDFVPMFTANKWDPDRWASLFENAGASFAGLAAEHGDGFCLWDTKYDEYNAADKGPQRDILGDLFEAVREHGMKTVATFHKGRGSIYSQWGEKYCPEGVDVNNPKYSDLYGPSTASTLYKKLIEVIDKYHPAQMWFEGGAPSTYGENNYYAFMAHYFNAAENWGRGVTVTQKGGSLSLACSVLDIEGGCFPGGEWVWAGAESPRQQRWQKDMTMGNYWAYAHGVGCRPVNMLVDGIVDRMSKNGLTLIDVAPKANGTLPEAQVEGLRKLGEWMDVNKPALYATQPAPFVEGGADNFKAGSLRFTRKGSYLYAIDLGNKWPSTYGFYNYPSSEEPSAPVTIPGVTPVENSEIRMLGSDKPLDWHQKGDDLVIEELPDPLPCKYAWSFKIQVSGGGGGDTTPPATFELVSPSNKAQITENAPTLEWESTSDNGSGLDHYEVWIDGRNVENVAAGTTRYTPRELSKGIHTWWVTAVDEAGNKRGADEFSFEVKKPTEPAEFQVTGLSLDKAEVGPGEPTTATVSIRNTGGETGSHTVKLSIDGKDKTQEVTLDPGATDNVEFSVSENKEGTYEVSAGGLTETFNVEKPGKPGGGGGLPLIPMVAGVIIVAAIIGVLAYRKS